MTASDARIARIELGIGHTPPGTFPIAFMIAALADLRAWQGVAERHDGPAFCFYDGFQHPCPDRQAADAALDRLDSLWRTSAIGELEAAPEIPDDPAIRKTGAGGSPASPRC